MAAALALVATTGAANAADATCASKALVKLEPGLSMSSGSGAYRSDAPSTIDCAGSLAGATMAGEGNWSFKGRYGGDGWMMPAGDCLYASGTGRFAASLPTLEIGHGDVTITGTYQWRIIGTSYWAQGKGVAVRTRGGLFNPDASQSSREQPVLVTAVGELVPTRGGDCIERPIANARIVEDIAVEEIAEAATEATPPAVTEEPCAIATLGSAGPDRLTGTSAGDWMRGYGGRDSIVGLGGADCLYGDGGPDTLRGGSGADHLSGGSGADRLTAGGGADTVRAGGGADRIDGGAGSDTLHSADGTSDLVVCGAGSDRVRADSSDRLRGCEHVSD